MSALWPGVVGVGTDLLDARRIEQAYQRRGQRLIERFLTPAEQALWYQRHQSLNFVAKQFAAKEALAKALGTGIAKGVGFQQLQILRAPDGAPQVTLSGAALQRLQQLQGQRAWVSLSDEGHWVQAFAVVSA
ncbi:holo-[acyl-carrier-protein] synthase [Bacterioplanes sanyensis]|uniref:holo-ACP synthase n=1 Tax=Bacterioplanes sanyensis TaxID=1249553 RepID=UPI00167A7579|nr:holo-ACP synthase [Bacterioplanes sanyensis]GGY45159.1 holo-[acyl-carrier-protein] synthase [Bacterioplanes sanyensis]